MKVCSVCLRCYEDAEISCIENNHEALAPGRPVSRDVIANYRLESLLELNDIGETYSAINLSANQLCIIRIISANFTDSGQKLRQQFLREAKFVAALNHPNVVRLYESGVLPDGELYIVTESVKGQTLRECLSNVVTPSEVTAVTIARQIAEGLEVLHSIGIIHLNINPENIILTADSQNRLLVKIQNPDLGGIKQQFRPLNISGSETNLNELKYFSPEQCREEQAVGAVTDVYSLGIVLYEMLAGKPPFEASDIPTIIDKQINEPPPPVEIYDFNLRALLSHTLSLALLKHPTERLKSANAFARQLCHIEQVANHSPAPPPVVTLQASTKGTPLVLPKRINIQNSAVSIQNNNPALDNIAQMPIFIDRNEGISAPIPVKPVLIEWEQPEDIPSEAEALEVKDKEFNQIEPKDFTLSDEPVAFPVSDEPVAFALSNEEVEFITSTLEPQTLSAPIDDAQIPALEQKHVLSQDDDNFSSSYYIPTRTQLMSGGLVAILALFVFGFIVNKNLHPATPQQPVMADTSADKNPSKPEEARLETKETASSTEKPKQAVTASKEPAANHTDESASKTVNIDHDPVKPEKNSTAASKHGNQDQKSKDSPEVKQNVKEKPLSSRELASNKVKENTSNKIKETASSKVKETHSTNLKTKTGDDKKPAIAKQPKSSPKSDTFVRPRIVKSTHGTKTAGL